MAFPGLPFQPTERTFVHRAQVQQTVPTAASVDAEASAITHDGFDALVVANGHYAKPRMPHIPGLENFTGHVLHSHNYRFPEPHAGRNVVVLGGGQSGRDIAQELHGVAASVVLAHATPRINVPELRETAPITTVAKDGTLVTSDGLHLEADTLILATGYHFDFPFLDLGAHGLESVPPRRIRGLYQHMLAIHEPTLALVGLPYKIVPFPLFDRQGLWLKALWADRTLQLPSIEEMQAVDEQLVEAADGDEQAVVVLSARQWAYNSRLSSEARAEPLEPWRREVYEANNAQRKRMPWQYKLNEFDIDFSTGDWLGRYADGATESRAQFLAQSTSAPSPPASSQ
ncbi:uncharacterized protein MONBRDRAFT_25628 [Monosiga brevicollis MX1]|uniref:Flavin-containing monooxygenase n=1 Tax=Monosiga brevicollis TaxID=81824 RepID=A9UZY6_MONBE|nr:uncharacterized protein MONBRDRAFT_25628 [Monosiga brevicollis MX1]EDQ88921.1 predicted protein [Monosiga brevicollis MX1]|eukprot:XP_001746026.1 hypothetical protein [Monosiga brevicollis MX1]